MTDNRGGAAADDRRTAVSEAEQAGVRAGRKDAAISDRAARDCLTSAHTSTRSRHRDTDMDLSGIDCGDLDTTLGLFTPDIQNLEFPVCGHVARSTTGRRRRGRRASGTLERDDSARKPEWAVEEIKRCKKLGATCVWLRPNVMHGRALVGRVVGSGLENDVGPRHGPRVPRSHGNV